MTETTGAKEGKGRFQPGQSGNPAGRPRGSRHKITVLAEKLMADDAEAIVKAVTNSARNGDLTAARLVLDRIFPARKDAPINLEMPDIKTAADAVDAMRAIMAAVASGVITPNEATTLSGLLDSFVKCLEVSEFEVRLARLEAVAS